MRATTVALSCLALGASVMAFSAQEQFRATTDTVRTYVIVHDRDGHVVTGLTADDFEARVSGKTVPITVFSNDPQPINVALLVETNFNIAARFAVVIGFARQFIDALTEQDRALLALVNNEVVLSGELSNDFGRMRRMLATEVWIDLWTGARFWTAAVESMSAMGSAAGRRTLLVVGSGRDSCARCVPFDEVRRRAVDGDYLLYVVRTPFFLERTVTHGFADPQRDTGRLVRESGGVIDRVDDVEDVAPAVTRAIRHLRHQYLIGFTPAARDGREHELDVRVRRPGLTARARQSYTAPSAP